MIVQWLRLYASEMQGLWVQPLVGELRSHNSVQHGQKKKNGSLGFHCLGFCFVLSESAFIMEKAT